MDPAVLRAMARWPQVPAVYGWLALDRRGNWLIKAERIANPLVAEFIANTMVGIEFLWGGKVQMETSEVVPAPVREGFGAEKEEEMVYWRRVLYTMEGRKLAKENL